MTTFTPDGYFRGPFGPRYARRGTAALRAIFTWRFSAGGGIGVQDIRIDAVTAPATRLSVAI